MRVNNIIKQVATYLQLSNVLDADLDDYENLDLQTKKDINLILSSMNEVLSDIATDYLPLVYCEEIEVENSEFEFSNLTKPFYKLQKIETKKPYNIELETLYIANGKYKIHYQFLPDIFELGDEITDFDSRLTIFAVCYGVASEFCLISGNYSESELWNSRFESAMDIAKRQNKVFSLKSRRWL